MTLAFLYSAGTNLGAASAVPAPRMANGTDMLLSVSLVGFLTAQLDDLAGGSDYRDRRFGRDWGILIEEHELLARAVFVIDRAGVLRYSEIVPEITSEPDYASALDVLFDLV